MKSFILSLSIFAVSFFGFIVAPMFIFRIHLPENQQVNWTDERALASEQIEINKSKNNLSWEELQKLYEKTSPQKKIQYSAREIYSIGQNNYLWFSWIPVFILFFLLSKTKKELLYFVGIAIFFFIIGVININTLVLYVLAALFGWLLKIMIKIVRPKPNN